MNRFATVIGVALFAVIASIGVIVGTQRTSIDDVIPRAMGVDSAEHFQFLNDVHAGVPSTTSIDNSKLLAFADGVCEEKLPLTTLWRQLNESFIPNESSMRKLVASAHEHIC